MSDDINKIADHYGLESQLGILQEECAELIQAVSKYMRGHCSDDHLAEEMADVFLMLNQIMYLTDNQNDVEVWLNIKIKRQLERIKGEEHG